MLLALLFTVGMFGGYVMMFRGIFVKAESRVRIGWRESYQITMAGLAASRIFAAGGAGGLVLMAWALRRSGMRKRLVADKTLSFLILTYFPYVVALIVCGLGLRLGIFPGAAPFGLTRRAGHPVDHRAGRSGSRSRSCRPTCSAASAAGPAARAGSRGSPQKSAHAAGRGVGRACGTRSSTCGRATPRCSARSSSGASRSLVLWAAFKAFGDAPPAAVLIQAFFCGMLGNLLPMPGGVGGVEGGMIGALVAFGVDGGLAVVAVLVFRGFTFWLPLIPGVIAFVQLRATVERWALHYTK